MEKTIEKLQAQIEQADKRIEQLEHQKVILENRQRYLDQKKRRARTHKLITRGGAIKSIAPDVKPMPEVAFYEMMERILTLPEADKIIRAETAKYNQEGREA